MKRTYIPIIIVLILVVAGGVLIFAKQGSKSTSTDTTVTPPPAGLAPVSEVTEPPPVSAPPPVEPKKVVPPPPSQGVFSGEEDIEGNDVQVMQIEYDGKGFSPASLTIKAGDIVVFKNTSKSPFWPASDPHPQHTGYPGFDADAAIAAGKTFQFKFIKTGTWGFHDHITPSAHGTIIVTK